MAMTLLERAAATRQSLLNKALQKKEESPFPDFSLRGIPQIEEPEACNSKWNAEIQPLIDWFNKNWDESLFPVTGKLVSKKVRISIANGADSTEARDGTLLAALKYLKELSYNASQPLH